jgi:integrase
MATRNKRKEGVKMANIEKRGENSYRLVASDGYDANGKKLRKYRTITLPKDMTELQKGKELTRQAVLFDEAVRNGECLDGEKTTFAEYTAVWLKTYAEKKLAPGTLKTYKTRLEKRIIPAIGHIKLSKLKINHLKKFYNNLSEEGVRLDKCYTATEAFINQLEAWTTPDIVKLSSLSFKTVQRIKKGNPTKYEIAIKICAALGVDMKKVFVCENKKRLSDKTIRHHHGIISTILSAAMDDELILSNPAKRVKLGKMAKYKPAYYDDEKTKSMLIALENEPLRCRAMIYLTIDTGMRTGEITGLKWADINLDKGVVTVDRQRQYVHGFGIITRPPKTEEGYRTITLSETVTALLKQYKRKQLEDRLKLGDAWKQKDDFVFTHEDGASVHPHFPYIWFTRFLERHSLPKITFHQLRHTNASLLIFAGVDLVTLSGRLGHADKNITLGVYSHIIKSAEAQAANRMDMFYSNLTEKDTKNKESTQGVGN